MNFYRILPQFLPEYELLDSGNFEKLERFGSYILRRPEPQAIWQPSLKIEEWENKTQAFFERKGENNAERGNWQLGKGMPEQWWVQYKSIELNFSLRLGLTSFKHVGIFPEQAENWEYISKQCKRINAQIGQKCKVLNLFAYTGAASLAACASGADCTHVDSVRQVINWGNENMQKSQLKDIRWVVEDAFKFVQREVKRGKKYNGIILDPPAYGRGPDGEKWILDKQLFELIQSCKQLLENHSCFFILNLYSLGYSPMLAENIVEQVWGLNQFESGELYLKDKFEKKLPLGTFLRFSL